MDIEKSRFSVGFWALILLVQANAAYCQDGDICRPIWNAQKSPWSQRLASLRYPQEVLRLYLQAESDPELTVRDRISFLRAYAVKLRTEKPDLIREELRPVLPALLSAIEGHLSELDVSGLAAFVLSIGGTDLRVESLLQKVGEQLEHRLRAGEASKGHHIVDVLWGFSRLAYVAPASLLSALAARLSVKDLNPEQRIRLGWSLVYQGAHLVEPDAIAKWWRSSNIPYRALSPESIRQLAEMRGMIAASGATDFLGGRRANQYGRLSPHNPIKKTMDSLTRYLGVKLVTREFSGMDFPIWQIELDGQPSLFVDPGRKGADLFKMRIVAYLGGELLAIPADLQDFDKRGFFAEAKGAIESKLAGLAGNVKQANGSKVPSAVFRAIGELPRRSNLSIWDSLLDAARGTDHDHPYYYMEILRRLYLEEARDKPSQELLGHRAFFKKVLERIESQMPFLTGDQVVTLGQVALYLRYHDRPFLQKLADQATHLLGGSSMVHSNASFLLNVFSAFQFRDDLYFEALMKSFNLKMRELQVLSDSEKMSLINSKVFLGLGQSAVVLGFDKTHPAFFETWSGLLRMVEGSAPNPAFDNLRFHVQLRLGATLGEQYGPSIELKREVVGRNDPVSHSPFETTVESWIRANGWQVEVAPKRNVMGYQMDFVLNAGGRLIDLEVDGDQHYMDGPSGRQLRGKDVLRDEQLGVEHYSVIRFDFGKTADGMDAHGFRKWMNQELDKRGLSELYTVR